MGARNTGIWVFTPVAFSGILMGKDPKNSLSKVLKGNKNYRQSSPYLDTTPLIFLSRAQLFKANDVVS